MSFSEIQRKWVILSRTVRFACKKLFVDWKNALLAIMTKIHLLSFWRKTWVWNKLWKKLLNSEAFFKFIPLNYFILEKSAIFQLTKSFLDANPTARLRITHFLRNSENDILFYCKISVSSVFPENCTKFKG